MTSFHDPSRPRLANGNPTWLTASRIALPGLYLTVAEPPGPNRPGLDLIEMVDEIMVWVEVVVGGCWAETQRMGLKQLGAMLFEWRDDPEAALVKWFGQQPPTSRVTSTSAPTEVIVTSKSEEELGL